MSKKEKLILLVLNVVVIIINVLLQAYGNKAIKLPSYIVNGLVLISSAIRFYLKGVKNEKTSKR